MITLKKLIEQREALDLEESRYVNIVSGTIEGEAARALTDEEKTAYASVDSRAVALDTEIVLARKLEASKLKIASRVSPAIHKESPKGTPEQKLEQRMSLHRAIADLTEGRAFSGAEAEAHQEAVKEANEMNLPLKRGFSIPSSLMQKRAVEIGGTASGAAFVPTSVGNTVPALRPELFLEQMGATYMTGLSGNMTIPVGNALATASFKGEKVAADESNPTVAAENFTPHRLPAYAEMTRQLIMQSSYDVEAWTRRELMFAIASEVQRVAINGSGTLPEPEGILSTAGIGSVAFAGGPTHANVVDLKTAVRVADAAMGRLGFLTNDNVRGAAEKALIDAGSGQFLWNYNTPNSLHGRNAVTSSLVPATLGVGTDKSAMIYGDWSKLLIGQWGGMTVLVNPYIKDTEGIVRVTVDSYWDVLVQQAAAFAAAVDITA